MERLTHGDEPHAATTVEAWSTEWLSLCVDLKPSTRALYRNVLDTQVLPVFRDVALKEINGLTVRRWVADMNANGLSASRIRQSHNVLSAMLAFAVQCGLLERNAAHGTRLPPDLIKPVQVLTASEVERLAQAIRPEYRPLIHVLGYGGLRFGEAAALRRRACDLDHRRLIVAESITEVGSRLVLGETKTGRIRKAAIPAFLVAELRSHLECIDAAPDRFVFTAPNGGPLRLVNFRRRVWWPALEVAGLPRLRVHSLRHTCASLLIRQGVHPKAVQYQLGHARIALTMDRYAHLFADQFEDLARRLDDAHAESLIGR
ncbi:MAG: tyrosine-type recombinase/integrase [Actinomycetota bacterium]